ncbi:MAG: DUF817 family protein [Microbacterium sp.]
MDFWAHARLETLRVGAAMLACLVAARLWYPDDALLARNDALVIAAVAIRIAMLVLGLEHGRELWVIMIFHVVGTVMELFKTDVGSWSYATDGKLRMGVALFIWLAENIATAAGARIYPNQADGWHPVSISKLVSWLLLMLISVVLVTLSVPVVCPELVEGPVKGAPRNVRETQGE